MIKIIFVLIIANIFGSIIMNKILNRRNAHLMNFVIKLKKENNFKYYNYLINNVQNHANLDNFPIQNKLQHAMIIKIHAKMFMIKII